MCTRDPWAREHGTVHTTYNQVQLRLKAGCFANDENVLLLSVLCVELRRS